MPSVTIYIDVSGTPHTFIGVTGSDGTATFYGFDSIAKLQMHNRLIVKFFLVLLLRIRAVGIRERQVYTIIVNTLCKYLLIFLIFMLCNRSPERIGMKELLISTNGSFYEFEMLLSFAEILNGDNS